MTRYFMTIPEAVQLVIRAGSGGFPHVPRTAEVLVLDMGEPVRIVELARAMIELSGLDPDRDIEIEIVGRRAGEKLHEELFNPYERARPTATEKILLAERAPLAPEVVEEAFAEINLLVLEGDAAGLAAKVAELTSQARRRVGRIVADPSTDAIDPAADLSTGTADPAAHLEPVAAAAGEPATAPEAPVPLIHSGDA
jgi:FlaA1/EpsC-like NDP-sugar epimerase